MQPLIELHSALQAGWRLAARVRVDLLEIIRPLTAAQWAFRPTDCAWCIAEVVEHLLRAEIGSSKMVRKLIRGDYRGRDVPAGTPLYSAALSRYPFGSLVAPHDLGPGPVRARVDLERELALAHSRFRTELERFRGDDPEALRSPDPATGAWFTLAGWVKLQAWHEAHHILQIQRIVGTPGLPR